MYMYMYMYTYLCVYTIHNIYIERDVYIVLNRHLLGANTFCPTEYTGLTSSPAMRFGSWCPCAGQLWENKEGGGHSPGSLEIDHGLGNVALQNRSSWSSCQMVARQCFLEDGESKVISIDDWTTQCLRGKYVKKGAIHFSHHPRWLKELCCIFFWKCWAWAGKE